MATIKPATPATEKDTRSKAERVTEKMNDVRVLPPGPAVIALAEAFAIHNGIEFDPHGSTDDEEGGA